MECLRAIFCCCKWAKTGEKTPLVDRVNEMGMLLKIHSVSNGTYSDFDIFRSRPLNGKVTVVKLSSDPQTQFYIGREEAKKLVAKFGIEKTSEPKLINISCPKGGALKVSVNNNGYRAVKGISFEAKRVKHSGSHGEIQMWEEEEGKLTLVKGSQYYGKKKVVETNTL